MKSSPKKVNIVFPIEILNRELDYRILLAVLAAREGNRIWIGQHKAIYRLMKHLPGVLYVGQQFTGGDFPKDGLPDGARYKLLKRGGGIVMMLQEEGGVYNGGPETWARILDERIDPLRFAPEDHICTWGEWQQKHLRKAGAPCTPNIHALGHPRFDLPKAKYRAYFDSQTSAIRERFGSFILINTNISRANYNGGMGYWFRHRRHYNPKDFAHRTAFINHWAHQLGLWSGFIQLINHLAHVFPETNFVLRPHPGENIENYHAVFEEIPNVHVVREGGVVPWLLACRALIHDGCTTGIEAHLADVPIINWKPLQDERYDLFLPNVFGTRANHEDEAIDMVGRALKGELKNPTALQMPELATQMLANLQGEATETLVNLMHNLEPQLPRLPFNTANWARREGWRDTRRRLRGEKPDRKFGSFREENLKDRFEAAMRVVGRRVRWNLWNDTMVSVETE